MSLSAIQDNLVKTTLVQQTQSRGDDVNRGQEIAQAASQREHDRREDQVVIHSREAEQRGVRSGEERERQRRQREEEEEQEEKDESSEESGEDETGTRVRMRRINIVV